MGLLTAFMMIIGGVMFFSSVLFRAPDAPPITSLNLLYWTPVWKRRQFNGQ